MLDVPSEANAFTVINAEAARRGGGRVPARVNVVKPLQRDDGRTHLSSAAKDQVTEKMVAAVAPMTILDPKFTRALDFKLRRLKEKEILEANLRRPTRNRRRPGALATSNPNLSWKDSTPPKRTMSQSQPRIDTIPDDDEQGKIGTKPDKSPNTNKSRSKASGVNDTEKPRFITTVKSGQFLLPPPGVACLLGLDTLYPSQEREKIVYSYSSKPKAVSNRSKRSIPDKKTENIPNVAPSCAPTAGRTHAGELFGGVRSLIAGVAGVKHLLDQHDHALVYCHVFEPIHLIAKFCAKYINNAFYSELSCIMHTLSLVSITDATRWCESLTIIIFRILSYY